MAISDTVEKAQVADRGTIWDRQPYSYLRKGFRFLRRWPVIPIIILAAMIVMALIAPLVAPYPYDLTNLLERNAPGFWDSEWYAENPGANFHLLGTDAYGRDIMSRVMYGSRISLSVSAIAIVTGMVVGSVLGLAAGYYGRLVDEIISRFVDIWLSLPFILVALIAAIVFGTGFGIVLVLMTLLAWSVFVRNIRAEVLSLRERDYVNLARISGASDIHILWKHLLPGVVNTIIVIATLRVGQLVLAEATLSYLGAGLPSPTPAWGLMVAEGREFLRIAWWTAFFPGISIVLLVLALNFLGDWFRDHFDPRLRQLS